MDELAQVESVFSCRHGPADPVSLLIMPTDPTRKAMGIARAQTERALTVSCLTVYHFALELLCDLAVILPTVIVRSVCLLVCHSCTRL